MTNLHLTKIPTTKVGMLIRTPVAEVFEAFVNPDVTTKFWFTQGTGVLEVGRPVQWEWEMYGFSIEVTAKVIEPSRRIVIEWPGAHGPTTVEWTFEPEADDATFVSITESGFTGDGDDLVKQVTGSTEGFTLVIAGAKAYLEHGLQLNLVADRFPKGLEASKLCSQLKRRGRLGCRAQGAPMLEFIPWKRHM